MINRKVLATVLPVVGAAVIAGSGFAAWYFGDTVQTQAINGTVEVTPVIYGELTTTAQNFKVVLDQGGIGNTNVDEGISIVETGSTTNVTECKATYTYNGDAGTLDSLGLTGGTLTLKCEVAFDAGLLTYLEVKDNAFTTGGTLDKSVTNKVTYTQTIGSTDNLTTGQAFVFGFVTDTTDKVNEFLKYTTKPADETAYQNLKTACDGKSITVTFSATIA